MGHLDHRGRCGRAGRAGAAYGGRTVFPSLVAGLLVVEGVHPEANAEPLIQPWIERARSKLNDGPESQIPSIVAWRRAYTQMGLKPTKYRSAAEALLRRFKREDNLPRLHPLVDLCNAVSLAFALPIATFDLEHVDSFIEVRHARGDEAYLAFNGEIEQPTADEVIFADAANHVHARRWTFRQSRRSIIQPKTERVLIVSEGLHEDAKDDINALINALADNISALWAAPKQRAILSANEPRLIIAP